MGFLKLIVQFFFVCFELTWVGPRRVGPRRVGPRRGGPTQKKWGPEGWKPRIGAPKGGGSKGGGPKVGGPKFRAFFSLSRRKIRSFLPSLGVFSWNLGGV